MEDVNFDDFVCNGFACLKLGIRIQDQGFQSVAKSRKVIHSFDPHYCET